MNLRRRAIGALLLFAAALAQASPALACSPLAEEPTIAALGPDQVVVVGTIGEQVAGGRVFHVERWFNPGPAQAEILIAFKEGEPLGDCSYPVSEGQHLIIAPDRDEFGTLRADLVTLQADPATETGLRYLAEAESLFGAGEVPQPIDVAEPGPDVGTIALIALLVAGLGGGLWFAFRR